MQPWQNHRKTPHPWQRQALLLAMASLDERIKGGKDARGVIHAATGTGKSLLQVEITRMLLPYLRTDERIVVSVPSQDLVDQMYNDLNERLPARVRKWYQYERKLDRPIVVACHKSMMEGKPRCLTCKPLTQQEIKRRRKIQLPLVPLAGSALRMSQASFRCGHDNIVLCPKANTLGVAMMRKGLRARFWIADEIHQTENLRLLSWEAMSRPFARVGFTATPYRTNEKEGISLFEELLFSYGINQAIADKVIVPPRFVFYEGTARDIDVMCVEMIRPLLGKGVGIVNAWDCEDADQHAAFLREHGIRAESIHSRHKKSEQKEKLRLLRRRRVDCLVHVNLLSEGRNFPWLSWLCLRRWSRLYREEESGSAAATMSRTRYIQEIGRVLRRWFDKEEAIILDPNGLSAELQLFYDERLGVPEETPRLRLSDRDGEKRKRANAAAQREARQIEEEGTIPITEPLAQDTPLCRWLFQEGRRLVEEKQIAPMPPPPAKTGKHGRDPTVEQYVALRRLMPLVKPTLDAPSPNFVTTRLKRLLVLALRRRLTRGQMHVFLALLVRLFT